MKEGDHAGREVVRERRDQASPKSRNPGVVGTDWTDCVKRAKSGGGVACGTGEQGRQGAGCGARCSLTRPRRGCSGCLQVGLEWGAAPPFRSWASREFKNAVKPCRSREGSVAGSVAAEAIPEAPRLPETAGGGGLNSEEWKNCQGPKATSVNDSKTKLLR